MRSHGASSVPGDAASGPRDEYPRDGGRKSMPTLSDEQPESRLSGARASPRSPWRSPPPAAAATPSTPTRSRRASRRACRQRPRRSRVSRARTTSRKGRGDVHLRRQARGRRQGRREGHPDEQRGRLHLKLQARHRGLDRRCAVAGPRGGAVRERRARREGRLPSDGEGEDRRDLHLHGNGLRGPTEPADVHLQQRRRDDRRVVRQRRIDQLSLARTDSAIAASCGSISATVSGVRN